MVWFLIEWLSNFKIDFGYFTQAREFINGRLFFFFIFFLLSLVYFLTHFSNLKFYPQENALEKIVKADVELVIDLLKYLGETDFH
jgi:hypothetical protein